MAVTNELLIQDVSVRLKGEQLVFNGWVQLGGLWYRVIDAPMVRYGGTEQ